MFPRRSLEVASFALLLLGSAFPASAGSYQPDPNAPRSQVPDAYKWHTSDIYATPQDWEKAFEELKAHVPELAKYKGHLAESADSLYQCLADLDQSTQKLYKLYSYASLNFDVDQSNDEAKARLGKVEGLIPVFESTVSFVEPELVAMDQATLDGYLQQNEDLRVYAYYIQDARRLKDHVLSPGEERILGLASALMESPSKAHEALLEVDVHFPEIVDELGQKVELTQTGFGKYRASELYNVRKQAQDAFFGTLRAYEDTFAATLDGVAKAHVMVKEARGYDSCLEAALAPDNISPKVYTMLIDTIRENLPRTLHKYVDLRREVLGIDGPLTFANLYNPLVEGVEPSYTYEEGRELVLEALKPMGDDYVKVLAEGTDPANGWIDVYPNANKRSGAYMSGYVYDVHPYVLHNYNNTLEDVFTLAHEFGHAMHSYYSNKNQPPVYAQYKTFLAEIASTNNEALLLDYLLEKARKEKDTDLELLLLNRRLEDIRLTIFRQTLFAEFELRFHEQAEKGEALTPAFLDGLYHQLIQDYYGPNFELGPDDEVEWAFIPHFYYDFYVFTYATGLTSGLAISEEIRAKGKKGREAAQRYKEQFLSAGDSAPPLEILKRAGVDLESPEPILAMLDLFEETVDEFQALWEKTHGEK